MRSSPTERAQMIGMPPRRGIGASWRLRFSFGRVESEIGRDARAG